MMERQQILATMGEPKLFGILERATAQPTGTSCLLP